MPAAVPGAYANVDLIPIRRALLSVSDKTGIVDFARRLVAAGAEVISTGGTAAALHYALSVKSWDVCDMNCDGSINSFDIDPFVLALTGGEAGYSAAFPTCNFFNADVDDNGSVNSFDIDPFVACLTGG